MSNEAGFRLDIQGLRAIAVLLVLIFHVWPTALPGGYIGVDVFFVISGFLITGLLVREFEREGSISLLAFYARRIRRLLPAATLTLVAVAIGGYFFLPASTWSDLAQEVFASGVYVENLVLVSKSVDYLALQEAASPVQHYWSLSVEEQFYILWPLLMIAAGAFARKAKHHTRAVFAIALAAITLASFAYGVYMSYTDPAPGYFLTTTRIWELGIGGLLAILAASMKPSPGVARIAGWAGVAAILSSAWFYTTGLPFPGYEALLPTLGAAAMIYAGAGAQPSTLLNRILGLRWVQYFGDISYSLYLWHWPIVVLYPYITGRSIERFQDALTVLVLSIVAAHLSKYGVEDRMRHPSKAAPGHRPNFKPAYAMGVACMLTVAVAAAVPYRSAPHVDPLAGLTTVLDKQHPGAEAFLHDVAVPAVDEYLPAPGMAKLDRGAAYGDGKRKNCIGATNNDEMAFCHFGKPDGKVHIVVVGDSHAVHWLPAFEAIGEQRGWKITGVTKSSCAVTDVTVRFGSGNASRDFVECTRWNKKMLEWVLATKPDLVVVSFSPNHQLAPGTRDVQRTIAQGTVRELRTLLDAGLDVAVIKHTPWQLEDQPGCLSLPGATVEGCSGSRAQVILDGPLVLAARADRRLRLLDFDAAFCKGDACPVVIGNVVVNRDKNHLTATFARSLAPALVAQLEQVKPTLQ
jgi:peptidoglycan/LPS O-acetylase OafA/YrhL